MRRTLIAAGLLIAFAGVANAQAAPKDDPWPDLVIDVFDGRPIADGAGVIALDAPYRAEDAAIVPITIRSELPAGSPLRITKVTLTIDNNPAPVAAVFTFGEAGTITAISTRVRVDSYTNLHAVAETSDGKLYAVAKFVKASGGCSSPGLKNPDDVAHRGEMQFRRFDGATAGISEAQIMIRHPNNSGLQRDPINNYYIPAFFIHDLALSLGGKPLLRVEGGISISENPSFRFIYSAADAPVAAEAKDTDGHVYTGNWPAAGNAT